MFAVVHKATLTVLHEARKDCRKAAHQQRIRCTGGYRAPYKR